MEVASLEKLVRRTLVQNRNALNAANYERYFKHVIKFYGIKTPRLNELFRQLYHETISDIDVPSRIDLAYRLFEAKVAEEKKLAISILLRNVKHLTKQHIPKFARVIDSHVYDWATCDGLAGRVIGRMIKRDADIAGRVHPWRKARDLWRQRASCVAFVGVARFGELNDTIIDICSTCIRNQERFVQLGAGWVLRELSLADRDLVVDFIKSNYDHFSREGLRYAIEKMTPTLREQLMQHGGT